MKEKELLKLALGLEDPWEIREVTFSAEEKRLDIYLDFHRGGTFLCPGCGRKGCKAYDTDEDAVWRHLNFFEHEAYLHARRPRINCSDCGVKTVEVPWGRMGTGFTYLFEAYLMILTREMSVKAIARLLKEHDTRIWRVIKHHVEEARSVENFHGVNKIGVDETARAKGHDYVSVFVDMDESKVIYVTKGKDSTVLARCNQDLFDHGGDPDCVREICCDMSPAFIDGAGQYFVNANITFDKFHVMKIMNEAVDEVRKQEQKEKPELKKTRYIWLKNAKNLTERQKETFESLSKLNLKTMRAYHIRLNLQEFWKQTEEKSEAFLKRWYFWATHSRLAPVKKAAKTVKRHWDGILRWFKSGLNNGILEGINSKIQLVRARARGFRNVDNFITMIYLIAGKLKFKLPT